MQFKVKIIHVIKNFKMWTIDPAGLWHSIHCYSWIQWLKPDILTTELGCHQTDLFDKNELSIHTVDLCIRMYKSLFSNLHQDSINFLYFNILNYILSALVCQEHLFSFESSININTSVIYVIDNEHRAFATGWQGMFTPPRHLVQFRYC